MYDNDLISDLYSYTKSEQDFPYIRRYMERVVPIRNEILQTSSGCERFMLAGLFLTYRASNHNGLEMTIRAYQTSSHISPGMPTRFLDEGYHDIHYLRLFTFKAITKKEIGSMSEYLTMIKFNPIKLLILRPDGFLVNFVTRNESR